MNDIFTLQFFFDLCIVLITLGISVLLERFDLMARWQKLCAKLTIAKIFFLLPWVLLPLALLFAAMRAVL